jgi:tetratricopeptide (TPR) repeat protein
VAPGLRDLVAEAESDASLGNWTEAASLVEKGLAYDSSYADLLYLSALVNLQTKDDARAALSSLDAALASGSFDRVARHEAVMLDASLLVREKRYDEALSLLAQPEVGTSAFGGLDPEYRRLRALALYGLGKEPLALTELKVAAERFPADPRFPLLFFSRCGRLPLSAAEQGLSELFISRLDVLTEEAPSLAVLASPFMLDARSREDAVLAYRAKGLASEKATLCALEYGIISDEAAVSEFFSASYPKTLAGFQDLASLLGTASGRKAFSKALSGFTGSLLIDRDRDDIPEERAVYASGNLVSWSRDGDQDGHADCSLSFREGLPVSGSLEREGLSLDLSYGNYPYLEHVGFLPRASMPLVGQTAKNGRPTGPEVYRFGPESLRYAPLALLPFPSAQDKALFLPFATDEAPPTALASGAAALELDRSDGDFLDVISLDHGVALRRERFLKQKIYSVLTYERGSPKRELVDADGDGRFETERDYRVDKDGDTDAVFTVFIDTDRDGLVDYSEESFFPFTKEWDLDHNGSMDVTLISLASGGSRLSIASRLDGNFDETIDFDASGSIVALMRRGHSAPLINDKNPLLRWIASKPFDIGDSLPPSDGIYKSAGGRYRLVYAGKQAFAELLP